MTKMENLISGPLFTRRHFVATSVSTLATVSGFAAIGASHQPAPDPELTVEQIINIILKEIPGGTIERTVDTLKSGKATMKVTGIVTTMFATVEVIRKAIELKANFIIAHEPTFYNHTDATDWLQQDKVYSYKKELLEKNNIVVWRFHDYMHTHRPDGVLMGLLTDLGWQKLSTASNPGVIKLPATSLREITEHVKTKLDIKHLRFVGDPGQVCSKILVMPGASGGRSQIQRIIREEPDLIICGEVAEWETSEYIRDAKAMGLNRSLIVLGHVPSEEPGMAWLVDWLKPKVQGISVTHVAANNPFTWN